MASVKNGTLDAWATVQKGATLNVKKGTYSRIENWGTVNATDGAIKGRMDVGEYFQQDTYALVNYGKMTISGGKVAAIYEGAGETYTGLLYCEQGNVEVKGGTLDAKGIKCIYNEGGEVVISKGKIIGSDVIDNRSSVIIKGGNIQGCTWNLAHMKISGGILSNFSTTFRCIEKSSTYISGGTFIAEQGSPFLVDEYVEPKILSISGARIITKSFGAYVFGKKLDSMKLANKNIILEGFEGLTNPYVV